MSIFSVDFLNKVLWENVDLTKTTYSGLIQMVRIYLH